MKLYLDFNETDKAIQFAKHNSLKAYKTYDAHGNRIGTRIYFSMPEHEEARRRALQVLGSASGNWQ